MSLISIITASYNASSTIADCLRSVNLQTFPAEHIIVDGASTDNTLQIVRRVSPLAHIISEPDKGIYDAMNKGLKLAKGDVIGILNADDFYVNEEVLQKIIDAFTKSGADAVFADLVYVKPENLQKIVRYYRGYGFKIENFVYGCMPPHPTFFVKRKIYEKYGLFKTDYKIAADFELLVRFMAKHRISCQYYPDVIVKMRTGGLSTRSLKSNWILNKEIVRACAENEIKTNLFKVYTKYLTKVYQLVSKPE